MLSQQAYSAELVRGQVEKILLSSGFARNERLSGFFRFVIEQELSGRGDELKESIIGVEFFGRRPDYDVRQDSVVRNEAHKLRARLAEYYVSEGAADRLIIELPKGGYKPAFRQIEKAPAPIPGPARPRRSVRIWLAAALPGCAIAAAAFWWWGTQHRNEPIPIAVLPLVNLDRNPDHDYFADGLTGEIIRNLSIIDGLAVRSRTSSFAFKGKPQSVHDVGKQLNAEYILEGSVLLSGRQLRIDTQLVRVRDDFPTWSGKYDRELTDVFAVQDEISRGIVNGLRLKLGRGRRRYETNAEAYDLYLRARACENLPVGQCVSESIPFFEQTIDKDPSFAPAYAGLAVALARRSGFDRFGPAERAGMILKMRTAAKKAIELDPLMAEAHSALGMMYSRDAQWEQSERSFRRSLELDPNSSFTRVDLVLDLLLPLGRLEEAVTQARMAQKADPLSANAQSILRLALFSSGRLDEAIAPCPKPCIEALLLQGKAGEAIPILEARSTGSPSPQNSALGRAYALAGRREDAERIADGMKRWPIGQAAIFTALGDKDRAFAALEQATEMGPLRLGRDMMYSEFIPLRGDPRFKAVRKKVGLPD